MIRQIQPWIDNDEIAHVSRVIESTYLTEGIFTREFEEKTEALTGAKHAIAVMNGTVALYCSLKSLDIGPGDEVIVPNFTFIATANAVIMAGATPVFCEIRPDTFCIDVEWAEQLVTHRTRAIIPVHLYGQAASMSSVLEFANRHQLKVIEDAAQAIGVQYQARHVGTFGEMGVISYYGNKTITCGEGGMVLTNRDDLALNVLRLKNHGRDQRGVFHHEHIGFNFSITEMQSAVGVSQMKKLSAIIERKQEIHDLYVSELKGLPGFEDVWIDPQCKPVYWFTSFLSNDANALETYLTERGIQTRRFFKPLHLQGCYKGKIESVYPFPISENIYHRGISLPSSYGLTETEQAKVIDEINLFYGKSRAHKQFNSSKVGTISPEISTFKLTIKEFREVVRNTPLVSIDLVIQDRQGKILVGNRRNSPAKDFLFVPGGRILKGEHFHEAIKRISHTELGFEVGLEHLKFIGVTEPIYDENYFDDKSFGTHYVTFAFLFQMTGHENISFDSQHSESFFLPISEIEKHPKIHKYAKVYFGASNSGSIVLVNPVTWPQCQTA